MLLTAGWLAAWQTPPQQPVPETPEATADQPIRVTTRLVQAPVTVIDKHGDTYVDGLQPQDFQLYDNGKEQNIHVDVTYQPISMVIAVQASDQVEGILPKINRIGSMIEPVLIGEQGEAAVMAFDHRFRVMQDFTSDPIRSKQRSRKSLRAAGPAASPMPSPNRCGCYALARRTAGAFYC